jgi:hypothetical protein
MNGPLSISLWEKTVIKQVIGMNEAVHALCLTDDVLSALTMKKLLFWRLYNVIGSIIPRVYIMRVMLW